MRKRVILITGAVGEIGQALIRRLTEDNHNKLLTLDLRKSEGRCLSRIKKI